MELYNNVYQYLKQTKMKGYWGMKESGDLSWTDKIDLNASIAQGVRSGMTDNEEMKIQEKLGKIRAKLRAGARLTGAEREYLKKHDPGLYQKVMALEREQAAYEEKLKKCRTRDDAEYMKTWKLAEMSADMKEEDIEYMMIRLMQMRQTEKKLASVISRKPWQRDLDKKRLEAYKKNKEKEDKKLRKKKAEKKRREEAARKKRMEEKIQQEAALKEEITEQIMDEKKLAEIVGEQHAQEKETEEFLASELMTGEEMTEEQIAKFMIAAGMMDVQATRIQVSDPAGVSEKEAVSSPASLGSSRGYAAYRAAADLPELSELTEDKKPYSRRV